MLVLKICPAKIWPCSLDLKLLMLGVFFDHIKIIDFFWKRGIGSSLIIMSFYIVFLCFLFFFDLLVVHQWSTLNGIQ